MPCTNTSGSSLTAAARFKPLARRFTQIYAALLTVVLLAGCGSFAAQPEAPTPTPIPPQPALEKPTYTVKKGDILEQMQMSGRVSATRQDDLYFTQAGNVAKILVKPDQKIEKGQVLAELQQGEKLNRLEQAKVTLDQSKLALHRGEQGQKYNIDRAELDLEAAQTKLNLAKGAGARTLADIGVRKAKINLEEARGVTNTELEKQVDQAQLGYDRIKGTVDAGRLYAPYNGQVGDISGQPGDAVQPYKPVLSVLDPREREIRAENIVSTDVSRLGNGQQVSISFSRYPDNPVKGVIKRLPGDASSDSKVESDDAVHIDFDAKNLEVAIGDLASMSITLQHKENVLWLPPQAVRTFEGRRFVVVKDKDRQRRVDVKAGITGQDKLEIVDGLKAGQVVIGQ